jgi:hypothetical protein
MGARASKSPNAKKPERKFLGLNDGFDDARSCTPALAVFIPEPRGSLRPQAEALDARGRSNRRNGIRIRDSWRNRQISRFMEWALAAEFGVCAFKIERQL